MVDEPEPEADLTPEELELAEALVDPVIWCETHLKNPDNPEEWFVFRDYQKDAIRHQPEQIWDETQKKLVWAKKKKLYRWGRRVGKSITLMAEILWLANTTKNYKVLLVAPYEDQIRDCWGTMRRMMQDTIAPPRIVEKPFIIEFSNGSWIKGLIGGVKQKGNNRGSAGRGKGCDCVAVVEMDHGIDHALRTVIMPIFLGKAHCRWIGDSTPSGQRGLFYQWCTTPESKGGAKEFYLPSSASPEWNEQSEKEARLSCESESKYQHEYLAEWGEETEGVFKAEDLEEIITSYAYDLDDTKDGCVYSMGVDWNQAHGVKIYITEWDTARRHYRTFYKHEEPNSEYTQTQAVDRIIDLAGKVPLSWIYVDKGFGTTQVELLHKHGKEHPESRLNKTVKSIDFKSKVELLDPGTRKKVEKPLKAFCVASAARVVENQIITIPEFEDHKNGLIGQMRGYKQRKTPSGNMIFEAENRDDLLVAWMLSLLAFTIETGEFTRMEASHIFRKIQDPMRLKDAIPDRTTGMQGEAGKPRILNNVQRPAGVTVGRFRRVVPGSKVVDIDNRKAPRGIGQKPLWKPQRSTPGRGPTRTNF